MIADPLILGVIGDHVRESVFVALLAVAVLVRFRRAKRYGAAAVGIASSAATTTVIVVVSLFGLVALGYWDPPIGTMVSDALGAGRTAWNAVGEWLFARLVDALERVAE
jgi:CHASE2 domain-containing sensor protein